MTPADTNKILEFIADGWTNREIAEYFNIKTSTLEGYLCKTIYPMLGCVSHNACVTRAEAVGRAYKLGYLTV